MAILLIVLFYGTPEEELRTCPLLLEQNVSSIWFTLCFILMVKTIFVMQKQQKTIIINLRHSKSQGHGETPGKVEIRADMLEIGFKLLSE